MVFLWDMQTTCNMDFTNYKYFYINGSSHVEGGGLEEVSLTKNSVIPFYEKKYGVSWETRKDVNFGTRLSEMINIECVNEAKCGGGPERVVRMTYEFIYNNWRDRNNFFIILEKPSADRFEFNFNNEFYIGNSMHKTNSNSTEFLFATRDYYDKLKYNEDKRKQDLFLNYHDSFINYTENIKKFDFAFAGLYSFCKRNDIKIFLMMGNDFYFNDIFDIKDIIKFEEHELSDILTFCKKNKLTIVDETNGKHQDFHPGYFGHIEYAKKLYKFLKDEQ
jgi:hypothetical protein